MYVNVVVFAKINQQIEQNLKINIPEMLKAMGGPRFIVSICSFEYYSVSVETRNVIFPY